MDDLRGAFLAEAPPQWRRSVTRIFDRWLTQKHGDQDISPPDPKLAASFGMTINTNDNKGGEPFNAFARFGKFFWRQVTRIH